LTEAQPIGAELALDLKAMKVERDFESCKKVFAEQDAVARFHVEEFDGENVRGTLELVAGEDERCVIAFFDPPLGDAVEDFEIGGIGALDEAEDVEVRVAFVEFAGGCGAVEGYGLEVGFGRGLQAVDEFLELGFHILWVTFYLDPITFFAK
jgi:hypothetical protein